MSAALSRTPLSSKKTQSASESPMETTPLGLEETPGLGNTARLARLNPSTLPNARPDDKGGIQDTTPRLSEICTDLGGGLPFQEEMEELFGQDFSSVKVGLGIPDMRDRIGAEALAQGEDVAFADANPTRETVAHELAHVAQAREGGAAQGASQPGDASERDAESAAEQVQEGEMPEVDQGVGDVLQGTWIDQGVESVKGLLGLGAQEEAQSPELTALLEKGEIQELGFTPSTGIGCFAATYTPASGSLLIELGVCFSFEKGDFRDQEWRGGQDLPEGDWSQDPMPYEWDSDESESWKKAAITDIQSFWSGRYEFHCTRPGFESLPGVSVALSVVEREAQDAHVVIHLPRFPAEGAFRDHYHNVPGKREIDLVETAADKKPDKVTHSRDSQSLAEQTGVPEVKEAIDAINERNPKRVLFDLGSSKLEREDVAQLTRLGAALASPFTEDLEVQCAGRTCDEAEEDVANLGLERAGNVKSVIENAGYTGELDTLAFDVPGQGAEARCVEININLFPEQETLIHETGHALGLWDEYPEIDPERDVNRPAGIQPLHQPLTDQIMNDQPGQDAQALVTWDKSVMSAGMEVRPQHYVTFLDALEKLSGVKEWAMGAGQNAVGTSTKGI